MVDQEHGGAPVVVTMMATVESCSPCGRVLREGAQGEEEWVARLWVRWIGRWRHGGGAIYGEARGGAGNGDSGGSRNVAMLGFRRPRWWVHELAEAVAMRYMRALELRWGGGTARHGGGARLHGDVRKKMGARQAEEWRAI
jgi:hypothetical protein